MSPRLPQQPDGVVRQSADAAQMESEEHSFMKLDDSIFVDFRKREEKLEEEIKKKDEMIR